LSLLKNQASSWAGTPSVMHTMNSMPASAASRTAAFTPGAGMKTHDGGAGGRDGLGDRGEDRDAVDVGAGLLGVDAATTWVP
jgi:hypothetical protein